MATPPPAVPPDAILLVAGHCDIVERLARVPPSARLRGVFFRSIEAVLQAEGKLEAYRKLFPSDRWTTLRFYPLRDYLIRLAVAGALLRSPAEVHAGMSHACRANAEAFSRSLIGKALLRLLSRDPRRLSEQALAARRQTTTYGRWHLKQLAPSKLEMIYDNEYIWIESAIDGSALGTYAGCNVSVRVRTETNGRFAGSSVIEW